MTQANVPFRNSNLLRVANRTDVDTVTLELTGELDISCAGLLELQLRRAEELMPQRIVLDLARLEFIDVVGLNLLIGALHRADISGWELVISRPSRAARRLFTAAGVTARLGIE